MRTIELFECLKNDTSLSSAHRGRSLTLCHHVNLYDTVIVRACMLNHFSCVRLYVTLWTVASQAPLSMGFFRQKCWSGFPCPSPGDLPDPGIKPASLKCPALAGYLPQAPLGKSEIGLLLLLLSRFRSQSNENVTLLSSIQVPFVLSTSCGPGPM